MDRVVTLSTIVQRYETLMQAGIPRGRIVLAYVGETQEQKAEDA